ncbi:YigZ family protein [Amycolatopsis sp. FDAARGOS 1241]|uniref:YigZ family protein n=1 Tax=Amycolatopsis sp. FDAARGOS 1241 TaxID=2778070 RepID=UPI00195213B3|nr:YigZ family protein [Amycolatopsis sp. FDAARGOS 1241]QRP48053.1 YigZ family protein [Amycolatopsis sp. FDAARGOS 1241]
MADRYLSVASSVLHEIEIKRSRFLCALVPVTAEADARAAIAARRKAEPSARHHCHAFVLGPDVRTQRSSDDGEPAGTAGVPMLEVLRRREITDTVAVVSRHFGGVLLGAGGLIRAYGQAVSDALDIAGIAEYRRLHLFDVEVDYTRAGRLENDLRSSPYVVHATHFDAAAHFEVGLAPGEEAGFVAWLADLTGGAAEAVELGEEWVRS